MRYLLIHFLTLFFIPFVGFTQQDKIEWQTYDSKTLGMRWKLPKGWKIAETQSNALTRIEFIGIDTSVNSSLTEYKELQGDLSDVLEKAEQENAFTEESRLTGESNGMESVTVNGQVTVDDELMDGEITIFHLGGERYLVYSFFTSENPHQARYKTIGHEIAKSFEAIIIADDLEGELPSEKEAEQSEQEEDQ